MRRRKKTVRNLLAGLVLILLGMGMLLSPYGTIRWVVWREAPEAQVLWWGSLPYETMEGSRPWFSGVPVLFARSGDELLTCFISRYEGEALLTGVGRTPWPETGAVELSPVHGWSYVPLEEGILDGLMAVNPPEGTESAEVTVTLPDGQTRTAAGERAGELIRFWVPGEPEELPELLQADCRAVYRDGDGTILLEWSGTLEEH